MNAQITNALPVPLFCDNCCSENIKLIPAPKYHGKHETQLYACKDCGSSVGCHPGTIIPLGRMADKETRQLRAELHLTFDKLWKMNFFTRSKAYNWLARVLNIQNDCCHVSWLNKHQLEIAIDEVCKYLANNLETLKRRREKANDRNKRSLERTKRKINNRKSNR
jgi:hypothetical protein